MDRKISLVIPRSKTDPSLLVTIQVAPYTLRDHYTNEPESHETFTTSIIDKHNSELQHMLSLDDVSLELYGTQLNRMCRYISVFASKPAKTNPEFHRIVESCTAEQRQRIDNIMAMWKAVSKRIKARSAGAVEASTKSVYSKYHVIWGIECIDLCAQLEHLMDSDNLTLAISGAIRRMFMKFQIRMSGISMYILNAMPLHPDANDEQLRFVIPLDILAELFVFLPTSLFSISTTRIKKEMLTGLSELDAATNNDQFLIDIIKTMKKDIKKQVPVPVVQPSEAKLTVEAKPPTTDTKPKKRKKRDSVQVQEPTIVTEEPTAVNYETIDGDEEPVVVNESEVKPKKRKRKTDTLEQPEPTQPKHKARIRASKPAQITEPSNGEAVAIIEQNVVVKTKRKYTRRIQELKPKPVSKTISVCMSIQDVVTVAPPETEPLSPPIEV